MRTIMHMKGADKSATGGTRVKRATGWHFVLRCTEKYESAVNGDDGGHKIRDMFDDAHDTC